MNDNFRFTQCKPKQLSTPFISSVEIALAYPFTRRISVHQGLSFYPGLRPRILSLQISTLTGLCYCKCSSFPSNSYLISPLPTHHAIHFQNTTLFQPYARESLQNSVVGYLSIVRKLHVRSTWLSSSIFNTGPLRDVPSNNNGTVVLAHFLIFNYSKMVKKIRVKIAFWLQDFIQRLSSIKIRKIIFLSFILTI